MQRLLGVISNISYVVSIILYIVTKIFGENFPATRRRGRDVFPVRRAAYIARSSATVATKVAVFDMAVADLTEQLRDPVDVLFGVQLGGGTDINRALAHCQGLIRHPPKTHLNLITDLYEGGDKEQLLARAAQLVESGVNLIVLLALNDAGRPGYDPVIAQHFAALGAPVFACTPDLFPELMATALSRRDVGAWAAQNDIAVVRGE